MKRTKQAGRTRLYRTLSLILAATALLMPLAMSAQEEPKRALLTNGKSWKVNVVSESFPEKQMLKLQARIEGDQLVCRSHGSPILQIPLYAITRMSRDSAKDYPVAEFLMGVATQPSSERHRFGSKKYREEMAARMTLGGIAIFTLLFPRHKEDVHLFWTDEDGEHGAEFLMGRKEGRAMLQKLQNETGLKPRDLEEERKGYGRRRKELQRWIKKPSPVDEPERETPQFPNPAC